MNLGSFMDPEYPIFSTTLCYLEREDAYLMLHRVKKQDDYNHDKWVGVGGKFERFESPEDCLLREVREETGLTLTRWRCRGLLTFILGNMTEFIHLYTADRWAFLFNVRQRVFFGSSVGHFHTVVAVGLKYIID